MTEPEKYQALYNKISELYQLENTPTQDPLPQISVLAQNNQDIMPLLISDLSEQIWCAGWLVDCEFELWNRVQQYKKYGRSSPWGLASSEAIQKDIEILSTASDLTQKWALWKEEGPESIDLTSWEKIFQNSASNELKNITQPICGELGKLIEDDNWPRIQSCHLPAAHSQTHNFT